MQRVKVFGIRRDGGTLCGGEVGAQPLLDGACVAHGALGQLATNLRAETGAAVKKKSRK